METDFNPTIEPMSVIMKNILQKLACSLNTNTPISAVPTAPIPVQTAYEVPMGKDWVAFTSNNILMDNEARNPKYHIYISWPDASFAFPKQNAKMTSNRPAIIKIIQFIVRLLA